jgi:23S rRNA (guanosine2251-2'-O)-methyltransferase
MIKTPTKLPISIVVIADNLRSTYNVGSLFRTCEGLGVDELILTGYTPYPLKDIDDRLPHISSKLELQINKTALGAQDSLKWRSVLKIKDVILEFKEAGYLVLGLEQHPKSAELAKFKLSTNKVVLVVGNEVNGLSDEVMGMCDEFVEIPMLGKKESFNVIEATTMAIFHLRFREAST